MRHLFLPKIIFKNRIKPFWEDYLMSNRLYLFIGSCHKVNISYKTYWKSYLQILPLAGNVIKLRTGDPFVQTDYPDNTESFEYNSTELVISAAALS